MKKFIAIVAPSILEDHGLTKWNLHYLHALTQVSGFLANWFLIGFFSLYSYEKIRHPPPTLWPYLTHEDHALNKLESTHFEDA